MAFPGFDEHDFELFSIPDFAGRMGEIRSRLRPKLLALGEELNPRLEALAGLPTFPHVAQHMRRRVNPPGETWTAFCRDKKGYKRWTHYRVAVSGSGVRVTVFVEDDADDKPRFGERLAQGAASLAPALQAVPGLLWYTLAEEPVPAAKVDAATLEKLGRDLQRLKALKFQAGIPLPRAEALRLAPKAFPDWAIQQAEAILPLYRLGAEERP